MTEGRNPATVLSVHLSDKHEFSKVPRRSLRLIENWGVEGDSHAGPTDQHLYHIRRFGHIPNLRQVHLIQAETLDDLRLRNRPWRFGREHLHAQCGSLGAADRYAVEPRA
jgi:hypothetical protein